MFIENVYETPLESIVAHEGQGAIQIGRLFQTEKLEGTWHFIEYLVVPPGVTIGEHRHGANEEIYFILEGHARMKLMIRNMRLNPAILSSIMPGGSTVYVTKAPTRLDSW